MWEGKARGMRDDHTGAHTAADVSAGSVWRVSEYTRISSFHFVSFQCWLLSKAHKTPNDKCPLLLQERRTKLTVQWCTYNKWGSFSFSLAADQSAPSTTERISSGHASIRTAPQSDLKGGPVWWIMFSFTSYWWLIVADCVAYFVNTWLQDGSQASTSNVTLWIMLSWKTHPCVYLMLLWHVTVAKTLRQTIYTLSYKFCSLIVASLSRITRPATKQVWGTQAQCQVLICPPKSRNINPIEHHLTASRT